MKQIVRLSLNIQRVRGPRYTFCTKAEEEEFDLHSLLESGEQQAKARIIKQYTTIQGQFKELTEKLDESSTQVHQRFISSSPLSMASSRTRTRNSRS
jgi:hypothetical protein